MPWRCHRIASRGGGRVAVLVVSTVLCSLMVTGLQADDIQGGGRRPLPVAAARLAQLVSVVRFLRDRVDNHYLEADGTARQAALLDALQRCGVEVTPEARVLSPEAPDVELAQALLGVSAPAPRSATEADVVVYFGRDIDLGESAGADGGGSSIAARCAAMTRTRVFTSVQRRSLLVDPPSLPHSPLTTFSDVDRRRAARALQDVVVQSVDGARAVPPATLSNH